MTGLIYSASFEAVAVTAIQDLFEITAPADATIELISCSVGQSTDFGDAEAELLRIAIIRYATGTVTPGSTPTPRPHHVGYPAAGGVADVNNTVLGTTPTTIMAETFNIQASPGWLYKPIPEERIWISPSGILAVRLPVAPTDSLTMSGTITWAEYGG